MRAFVLFGLLLLTSASARASETITYTYDALGRLTKVSHSGSINSGANSCYGYDPANNRFNVTAAPNADCTPVNGGGGGGGGGGNNPPTPVNDTGSQQKCTTVVYTVTANDTDPDGDYPLRVTSATGVGFSVASPSEVQFTSTQSTGAKVGTYTVQDARGATATATLTVTVTGGVCP